MLSEEEKQKIIEEEKLRKQLQEEEKKKNAKNDFLGVLFVIILAIVFLWIWSDWTNKDMKRHPERYTTYEQGYIIIQPIK